MKIKGRIYDAPAQIFVTIYSFKVAYSNDSSINKRYDRADWGSFLEKQLLLCYYVC